LTPLAYNEVLCFCVQVSLLDLDGDQALLLAVVAAVSW
jgi:hypothetical protein